MSELGKMQNDLKMYEQQLASMGKRVKKDIPWAPGVQDQMHHEFVEYTEYSDPAKAKKIKEQIEELKEQIDNYDLNRQRERDNNTRASVIKAKETKQRVFLSAKQKYDKTMQEYMSMNFWGKAKAMLAGKKPKKMNNVEILKNYGNETIDEMLKSTIDIINQRRQDEIKYMSDYYATLSEEEKKEQESKLGLTLESRIRQINLKYDSEIEKVQQQYAERLDSMISRGYSL